MNRFLFACAMLAFCVCASDLNAQPAGEVSVDFTYLTDSDGYNYGANWYLNSSVGSVICVMPYVITANNVVGSVTSGPVIMQPYEKNVNIGQYISSDRSQPWDSNVGAKWKEGSGCDP